MALFAGFNSNLHSWKRWFLSHLYSGETERSEGVSQGGFEGSLGRSADRKKPRFLPSLSGGRLLGQKNIREGNAIPCDILFRTVREAGPYKFFI